MRFDKVYSCVTRYQLLCMILHRLTHREGSALLFVLNLTFSDEELVRLVRSVESVGVFDSVRIYNEKGVWDRLARDAVGTPVKATAGDRMERRRMPKVKRGVLDNFRAVVGDVAHDRTDWYVAADHYSFGMALVFAGTKYAQFEDHSGALEQPDLQLNTFARLNPFQHKVYHFMEEDRRRCIRLHVVDELTGPRSPDVAPVEELRVRVSLGELPSATLAEVLRVFDYEPGSVGEGRDAALLITQPFARWKFLDWMEQKELYYTLVDFFAPESKLIVKPHPQDELTPYGLWFPSAVLAPSKVPMELVLTSIKPSIALTIGSTAIFPIRGTDTATVFMGQGFELVYEQMPRLFAMATALTWLGVDAVRCNDGFPSDALQAFMGPSAVVGVGAEDSVALVCWADEPTASEFASYDVVASLTPITLVGEGIAESRVVVRRRQHGKPYATQSLVYLYSRDASRFDELKGMKLERTLPNLREDLMIVFPADEDTVFLQAQVASLEARVAGLTERLLEAEIPSNEQV